jgi:hypothetical protein
MSYPIQQYNSNNELAVDKRFNDNNDRSDIFNSFLGLANRMMGELLRDSSITDDMLDGNNPNVKVFGISSMNVTQISRGPDGRPHIVQAHDERRMGPGGVLQTKKALRDPERGIDKMQVGYFIGDQGEIIERQLDPTTRQYKQEIKRRGIPSNELNFSDQWRTRAQQTMRRPQQQLPSSYDQYSQQALPTSTPSYDQYPQQALSTSTPYNQYSQPPPLSYNEYSRVPPPPPFYEPYPSNSSSYQYY